MTYLIVAIVCLFIGAVVERFSHRRRHECIAVDVIREQPRALFTEPSVVGPNSRERFGETVVAVVRHHPKED